MTAQKTPRITVIGSLMTDLVISSQEFVKEGETIVGDAFHQYPGGKGANQAVTAARLGAQVTMVGKLGDDAFGRAMLAALQENQVDCSYMLSSPDVSTGVGNPQVDAQGHNRIVVVPGANMDFRPQELERLRPVVEASDVVVLQLEIPLETVYAAIDMAHECSTCVVLNPAPATVLQPDIAGKVDWLIPNEHEAEVLTGIPIVDMDSAWKAAECLAATGYRNAVITLGHHGAIGYNDSGWKAFVPAYCVDAVDTVAAGDSYIGAFSYGLASGWSPERAMQYASATAAVTVTRAGAIPSLPQAGEVATMLSKQVAAIS